MDISPTEIKDFAEKTLFEAGNIAKKYYRKNFDTKIKEDKSIVTIADEEIEEFIRSQINNNFHNHNILGEEQGGQLKADNYNWVIDPIDGTASFQAGKPIFTILFALYDGLTPIFGAIYQPIIEELLISIEGKLYFNSELINNLRKNNFITLATTSPDLLGENGHYYFNNLKQDYKNIIYGGDAYNYMLLALGQIDCIFEQGLKPHDYLPLMPILHASGIEFTDLDGKKITADYKGKDFLAKNTKTHL